MTTLTFEPIRREVESITQANPAVVTTTEDHGYYSGLYVRFFFPANFGMYEVNKNVYQATVLTSDTFSIDVDTRTFEAFDASLSDTQSPQVIPIAEIASTLANAEKNNLTPVGG